MNGGPVSQKQIFMSLSVVRFHIAAAGFVAIDAKRCFSLQWRELIADGHSGNRKMGIPCACTATVCHSIHMKGIVDAPVPCRLIGPCWVKSHKLDNSFGASALHRAIYETLLSGG